MRTILTPNLRLILPPSTRADHVLQYFKENRAHLERWEPTRPDGFYTPLFWHARLELNIREHSAGQSIRLFIEERASEQLVGTCNFSNVVRGAFQACHLGYAIGAKQQGRGLMYEALHAALPFGFEHLVLHRIMANYQPHNERSGRLLERLGFIKEGYARDYLYIDGAWRDHILTALVGP